VAVGQAPFNFQLGKDVEAIKLRPPATPAGELEVRVNGCDGVSVAVLPLAAAVDNDAVTQLPSVRLASLAGHHDLCFTFTQAQLDPLWAIDWVQVSP
jgi:hexosaminidase